MATLEVIDQNKKKVGTVSLKDEVFGVEINTALVSQVLHAQQAARRQGTACTKKKSEVRGGGKKPYKQKGTGNARRGSQRSPLIVGGGQNFGPRPRSYEQKVNKAMVRGALRSVLSDRVKAERLIVVDKFTVAAPKTKPFQDVVRKALGLDSSVLIVDNANKNLELSGRNLKHVKILRTEGINVYDIVWSDWLVMTQESLKNIEAKLLPTKARSA